KVYTIEGNTSSGAEVIANGGAVCLKEYALINSRIDGYGRTGLWWSSQNIPWAGIMTVMAGGMPIVKQRITRPVGSLLTGIGTISTQTDTLSLAGRR
ncbi:MAG: hypothetical protein LBQ71_19650, partial [Hungatella sp.]|nr:hypothetical protein [Hungatella sp.]